MLGVNVTLIVQLPPDAKGEEEIQLSVSEKSPPALTATMFRALPLLFVIFRAKGVDALPHGRLPKSKEVGENVNRVGGTATGTDTLTVEGLCPYVAVTVALPSPRAVTIPSWLTDATAPLDVPNVWYNECVTSAWVPSENVATILIASC
jgi:hypothetical protein